MTRTKITTKAENAARARAAAEGPDNWTTLSTEQQTRVGRLAMMVWQELAQDIGTLEGAEDTISRANAIELATDAGRMEELANGSCGMHCQAKDLVPFLKSADFLYNIDTYLLPFFPYARY